MEGHHFERQETFVKKEIDSETLESMRRKVHALYELDGAVQDISRFGRLLQEKIGMDMLITCEPFHVLGGSGSGGKGQLFDFEGSCSIVDFIDERSKHYGIDSEDK